MVYITLQNLFIYSFIALFISTLLVALSYIIDTILFFNIKKDFEKGSTYECGFQPFSDARCTVDIKFYLIAILFIIFDLEVVFIIPWALHLYHLNLIHYTIMLLFIVVLTLGFIYEWVKGALE